MIVAVPTAQSGWRLDALPKALRVLEEILFRHQAPIGKTKLFKAFYAAHLYFAQSSASNLSNWTIVKMPNGPGIDRFEMLLAESADRIVAEEVRDGPYLTQRFSLAVGAVPLEMLEAAESDAIQRAVEWIGPRTAGELSDATHEFSRAWQLARSGDELDVHLDAVPELEYQTHVLELRKLFEQFGSHFE